MNTAPLLDLCSPESADSNSGSNAPDSTSVGSVNQTSSVAAPSRNTGPTLDDTTTFERSQWPTPTVRDRESLAKVTRGANASPGGTPLLVAVMQQSEPTSSSADSPVRTSATPESVLVWKGLDPDCGLSSIDALASFDRSSFQWKTSQGSLFAESTLFSDAWPTEGLILNSVLYARPMLARHTTDRAFSSSPINEKWPTPQTTDANSAARHTTTTGVMHSGTTLTDAVRQWLTPQSPDQLAGLQDRESLNTNGSRRAPSPKLNPRWVAALMGFPVDWLDGVAPPSRRSGTPSSRNNPKSSLDASASSCASGSECEHV